MEFAVTARIDGVMLRNDAKSVYLGILSARHCQQTFEEILFSVNSIFESLNLRIG